MPQPIRNGEAKRGSIVLYTTFGQSKIPKIASGLIVRIDTVNLNRFHVLGFRKMVDRRQSCWHPKQRDCLDSALSVEVAFSNGNSNRGLPLLYTIVWHASEIFWIVRSTVLESSKIY